MLSNEAARDHHSMSTGCERGTGDSSCQVCQVKSTCCCSGETAAGSFPVQAVQVMNKICRESEASLDYYALFKVCSSLEVLNLACRS
jgi:Pyruvate kinase, barrel domain